jgi:two-component system, NtrC family, C4-dicarboxylate transport response regulator DctD
VSKGNDGHRSPEARRVRVLIIDPDPEERWNLVYLVQCRGIRAAAASSAETALRYLTAQPVDLVLSSLMLPGAAGLDLLRSIRLGWPSVKVILMTGQRSRLLLSLAMKCGAMDLISHPVREREVAGVLRWLG